MNKTILGLMVVPLVLSGCIKKAEENQQKNGKTSTIKATEQPPKEKI